MRPKWQLAALLALATGQVFGQEAANGIQVALEMPSSRWILGEDPQVTEVWTNASAKPVWVCYGAEPRSRFTHLRLIGPLRKDCEAERRMVEEGPLLPNPPKLECGKEVRLVHSLRNYGVVDAGHYEAWLEYDTSKAPAYYLEAGLPVLRLESNHVEFDIVAPQGVDAEVFAKYANKCHQIALSPDILLTRFPTSTYAGYVLEKKVVDYSDPLNKPVPPEEQVRRSREEGKTVLAFPDGEFEAFFQQLERYLSGGRVPENLVPTLYGFYGDLLVQRGRFAEAGEAFRKALRVEPTSAKGRSFYKRASEFLQALEAKKS